MKRKFLLFPLLAAMALASCGGGGGDGGTTEPEKDEQGNTIVKIWFHVDSKSDEGKAYKKRIDAFNNAYAEKKIVASAKYIARDAASAADYESELIAKKIDGDLPDIITFDAPRCASYAHNEILVDISNVLSADEKKDFLSLNTYGGKVYGLPIQESSAGIFYNKNLFRDAGIDVGMYTVDNPWTFEQFKDVCSRLQGGDKNKKVAYMNLNETTDEMGPYLLYSFIHATGGKFLSDDGWTASGYFNSSASKKGFQFLKDLIDAGYSDYNVKTEDFYNGNIPMLLSSGWTIPEMKKYATVFPNRDSWGLLPYPKDLIAASATGSWSYGVTDNGVGDKSATYELLKFLASAESSNAITAATGMIPARRSCNPSFEEGSPERLLYEQLAKTGKERPATVGYPAFSKAFNKVIYKIASMSVSSVVDEVAEELQGELDRLPH